MDKKKLITLSEKYRKIKSDINKLEILRTHFTFISKSDDILVTGVTVKRATDKIGQNIDLSGISDVKSGICDIVNKTISEHTNELKSIVDDIDSILQKDVSCIKEFLLEVL